MQSTSDRQAEAGREESANTRNAIVHFTVRLQPFPVRRDTARMDTVTHWSKTRKTFGGALPTSNPIRFVPLPGGGREDENLFERPITKRPPADKREAVKKPRTFEAAQTTAASSVDPAAPLRFFLQAQKPTIPLAKSGSAPGSGKGEMNTFPSIAAAEDKAGSTVPVTTSS
jgi:hypothetical protein